MGEYFRQASSLFSHILRNRLEKKWRFRVLLKLYRFLRWYFHCCHSNIDGCLRKSSHSQAWRIDRKTSSSCDSWERTSRQLSADWICAVYLFRNVSINLFNCSVMKCQQHSWRGFLGVTRTFFRLNIAPRAGRIIFYRFRTTKRHRKTPLNHFLRKSLLGRGIFLVWLLPDSLNRHPKCIETVKKTR